MPTPAVAALSESGIAHQLHDYAVDEAVGDGYGEAVAAALGVDTTEVFKTLLAEVDDEPIVAIIPVSERLAVRRLATAAGGKRCEMADPAAAGRLTGYVPGGISPLGQRRKLRVFVDESALRHSLIYVSGGKRGLQISLSPDDLISMTEAVPAPLT